MLSDPFAVKHSYQVVFPGLRIERLPVHPQQQVEGVTNWKIEADLPEKYDTIRVGVDQIEINHVLLQGYGLIARNLRPPIIDVNKRTITFRVQIRPKPAPTAA